MLDQEGRGSLVEERVIFTEKKKNSERKDSDITLEYKK